LIARGKIPHGEEKANTILAPVPANFRPTVLPLFAGWLCGCPDRGRRAQPRLAAAIHIKELAIFRNLDTIAQLVRRRKHGNEGKGNAVEAEGAGL
jgi:hypothetical protein